MKRLDGIIIIICYLYWKGCLGETSEWYEDFVEEERYYVGAEVGYRGGGDGTFENPVGLDDITDRRYVTSPGRLILLKGGDYFPSRRDGYYAFKCDGEEGRPCVIKCIQGERCTIHGNIQVYAQYLWVWGLEITLTGDPREFPLDSTTGCHLAAWGSPPDYYPGIKFINNYIHNMNTPRNTGGICTYGAKGGVIYGNIVFGEEHGIYTQNDFDGGHGYKYHILNFFHDSPGGGGYINVSGTLKKYFIFHGYVENEGHGLGQLTGLYVHRNMFREGRFLIGSNYKPEGKHIVTENLFGGSRLQLGYRQAHQSETRSNFLGFSNLEHRHLWGEGISGRERSTSFSGNTIFLPRDPELGNSPHIKFGVSGNAIPTDTEWADNTYDSSFTASTDTDGTVDSTNWQSISGLLDPDSNFDAVVPDSKLFLFPNEYEPKKAYLGLFNFGETTTVTIDICCYVEENATFTLQHYTDLYGVPISQGDSTDCSAVVVPIQTRQFESYVLQVTKEPTGSNICAEFQPDPYIPEVSTTSVLSLRLPFLLFGLFSVFFQ